MPIPTVNAKKAPPRDVDPFAVVVASVSRRSCIWADIGISVPSPPLVVLPPEACDILATPHAEPNDRRSIL